MISPRALSFVALVIGCTLPLDVGQERVQTRALGSGHTLVRALPAGDGSIFLTGNFTGSMQLGDRTLTTVGDGAGSFVARLDADDEVRWARSWSSLHSYVGGIEAVGDEVWLTGYAAGSVVGALDFDAGARQSAQIFGFTKDSGEGRVVRSGVSAGGNAQGKFIAVSGDRVAWVGHYVGELDVGDGPLPASPSTSDFGFVALFEGRTLRFVQALTDANVQAERVVLLEDTLLVSGTYREGSLFGVPNAGGVDGFATALDVTGATRWTQNYGSTGGDEAAGCAISGGRSFIVGRVSGDVDFGGATTDAPRGESDGFVHAVESNGATAFALRFGGPGVDRLDRIARVGDELVVAGSFENDAAFGELSVSSRGGRDLFVAGVSRDGEPRWVRGFGGAGDEQLLDFHAAGDALVLVANVSAAPDFGDGPLADIGEGALVVHRFRQP